eukprot:g81281.t1
MFRHEDGNATFLVDLVFTSWAMVCALLKDHALTKRFRQKELELGPLELLDSRRRRSNIQAWQSYRHIVPEAR